MLNVYLLGTPRLTLLSNYFELSNMVRQNLVPLAWETRGSCCFVVEVVRGRFDHAGCGAGPGLVVGSLRSV